MAVIVMVLLMLLIGAVIGGIARLVVPGRDPMGFLGTAVLGIAGSIVGGILANLVHHARWNQMHATSLLWSIGGAIVLLIVLRLFRGGARRY